MFRPHWVCPYRGVCAFPVYAAQAPGCPIWSRPCIECSSSFRVLHKSVDLVVPTFCVFPWFRQPEAWAPSTWVPCAFSLRGEQLRQPEACAPSPPVRRAFSLHGERLRRPEAWAHSPRMRRTFSLHGEWPRQPEAWVHSPRIRRAFSLRGPSARHQSGLRKSLDRNRGLFAVWEGVASLGLSLPLSPPPCLLLPTGMGQLEFLSPFVLRTAGSVFQLVNFSLLSHSLKTLPPTALRALGQSLP